MASRVLSARAASAALRGSAMMTACCVLVGCPHDFSAFEGVPTDIVMDASATGPGPAERDGSRSDVSPIESATFATMTEKPTVIAADAAGIVFLTAEGSVLACPHDGCALPSTIAAGQHDARSLAIGYGFVAWTARGDSAVRRSSRVPGQGPAVQASDNDGLGAIALTATKMYWAVDGSNSPIITPGVRRCTPGLDCQYPTFDGFADDRVSELKIDGADAFWLLENRLFGCPLAACDADAKRRTLLAADPVLPFALAVDAEQIYYGSPIDGGSVRAASRSALGGDAGSGGAPHALAKGLGAPSRLAVTASSVWFTDPAGTVARVPRKGGAAAVVAKGLAQPTGIAVGGGYVYVACSGDGRILRWAQD